MRPLMAQIRLLASHPVSTLATAPGRHGQSRPAPASVPTGRNLVGIDLVLGLGVAAVLVALAFLTSAGTDPRAPVSASYTWTLIALTLGGAGAVGAAVLLGARGRAWGAATVGLFMAFTAFAALSILWSVEPDWSWSGANELACYVAVLAGAGALARIVPERWPALLVGLAVAMAALSAYALLAKVFPATLAPDNVFGRLQAPFGYWNSAGVVAALGLPAALWLGAQRERGTGIRCLALPAVTLLVSVVVLSLSRTAALAAVVGLAAWLAFVPLRLRSVAVLAAGALGAVPIVAWALGHSALSTDGVPPAAQDAAGHTFGIVLLVVFVAAVSAGVVLAWALDHVRVSEAGRRRTGTVLVALVALIPVAAVVAMAMSSRGLGGEISHAWSSLTNSQGATDSASRLTQLDSSRPVYWHEGLQVGAHALVKGVGELGYGIARLRYTNQPAKSDHAHSYLVQTFADLGVIGLALTLALLVAWVAAAARSLAGRAGWGGFGEWQVAERAGLTAMAVIVLAFGVQSALDWTWYFPGVAVPALLCAGWLAGRGPLRAPVGRRPGGGGLALGQRPGAGALVTLLAAAALGVAWLMWQPLRSAEAVARSQSATTTAAAFRAGRAAAGADPLSLTALQQLSALYQEIGAGAAARAELVAAAHRAPQDPQPWVWLAEFDLQDHHPRRAIADVARVLALDHTSDPDTITANVILNQARAALRKRGAAGHRAHRRSRAR